MVLWLWSAHSSLSRYAWVGMASHQFMGTGRICLFFLLHAAIASLQAGVHYGLNVLAEQIEDNPSNTTRFAVIGDQPNARHRPRQDRHDVPGGAPARRLGRRPQHFQAKSAESHLDRVVSDARVKGAYLFFVEMEGHETDARLRRTIAALQSKALRLEVLGSFPAGEVIVETTPTPIT